MLGSEIEMGGMVPWLPQWLRPCSLELHRSFGTSRRLLLYLVINKQFRNFVGDLFEKNLDENLDAYLISLTLGQRRVLARE